MTETIPELIDEMRAFAALHETLPASAVMQWADRLAASAERNGDDHK